MRARGLGLALWGLTAVLGADADLREPAPEASLTAQAFAPAISIDSPLWTLQSTGDGIRLYEAGVLRDSLLEALAGGDAELDWSALSLVAARRAHLDESERG